MKKPTTSKKKPAKRKFIPLKKKKPIVNVVRPPEEPEEFEDVKQDFITQRESEILEKYPAPKKSKEFVLRWRENLFDVVLRDNFKRGHLAQLEVLCDLFVEYDTLMENVREHGYTYYAQTRNGDQWKQRAEVIQLNRTRAEIRSYSKTLGLLLVKDKEMKDGEDEGKEWG